MRRALLAWAAMAMLLPMLAACGPGNAPNAAGPANSAAGQPGASSPAGHILPAAGYPNPSLTPGDVLPDAAAQQGCTPGYASSVRSVTPDEKHQVYRRYGIADTPGQHEVDHFISLELGGSNALTNLWPEPYNPPPGAHEKDKVENYLHERVCDGALTLQQAQTAIRTDWYAVYQQIPAGQR